MPTYTPADSLLYLAAIAKLDLPLERYLEDEIAAHGLDDLGNYSDGSPIWTTTPRVNHPGHPSTHQ